MQPIRTRTSQIPRCRPVRCVGILLPIPEGHCNAGEQQRPEQRQDQIAPVSLMEIIIRRRGQEMPDIGEGIGGHVRVLQELNSYSTYRLMESLLLRIG